MATIWRGVGLTSSRLGMPAFTVPTRTMAFQRGFTSTSVRDSEDKRAASSKIFSLEEVEAGIKALEDAGYERASVWEQRVVWGDHDQFQHVNNVHFVRWFENARMFFANAMLESDNFTPERKLEITRGTGKSFILAGINVRYRRPVVYPDTILVGQACELPLGKDRFMLRGAAYSLAQKTIVAVSAQDCVTYDYTQLKKCDIPQDLRTALEKRASHFDKKL